MNKRQALLLFFLIIIFTFKGKSQLNFDIVIENYQDSAVMLTSYYGNKVKLIDTAYINDNKFTFSNKAFPAGVFILASPGKSKLFEFIINNESGFTFYADSQSYQDVKVTGSIENQVFFDHKRYQDKAFKEIRELTDTVSNGHHKQLSDEEIHYRLDSIKNDLIKEEERIIETYPGLFITRLLEAKKEISIPDHLISDSLQSYLYYKDHYWDRIDLKDERFIRTPILDKKLNYYFDNIVYLNPDSTITAIDSVISYARPSDEVVSYLLWFFISKYQNPKYMGFDAVFVHLVENYFLKEDVLLATPSIIEKLEERSEKLKPLLIGEPAPNLILIDTNGHFRSFREINSAFVLLLFWDYDCAVCDKEIKELQETIDTTTFDLKVYAVCTNSDLTQWKKTILSKNMNWINVNGTQSITNDFHDLYDINGTPRLFLLNSEKKIIAKYFKVEQLLLIIEKQFMKNKI